MGIMLWRVLYKRQELLRLREHMGSQPVFGGLRVAHLFQFLCFVICLVCLGPVCVSIVDSVSGLSIPDYSFEPLTKCSKQYY